MNAYRKPSCRDWTCGSVQWWKYIRKYWSHVALAGSVITIIIIMTVYNTQAPACNFPSCPNKWTKYDDMCYFASKNSSVWKQSKIYCEKEGGTLRILNDTVRRQIEELFPLQLDHWIGLTKDPGTKNWTWVNGSRYMDSVRYGDDHRMNCAYINRDIGALDCSSSRPWICMKSIEWTSP